MPKEITIILDSGCFIPLPEEKEERTYSEVGYFQCADGVPDFEVLVDKKPTEFPELNKLRDGCSDDPKEECRIVVRHRTADLSIKMKNVKFMDGFHKELLHMSWLYGKDIPVAVENFDCVIRFDSGYFSADGKKPRVFKRLKKNANGPSTFVEDGDPLYIMHDVVIRYLLEDGEAIELARNGNLFWSSEDANISQSAVIKILADDSTCDKYFPDSFLDEQGCYWHVNPSDPPPQCPRPPCEPLE